METPTDQVTPYLVVPNYRHVKPDEADLEYFEELANFLPSGDALADAGAYDELANSGGLEGAYFDTYTALIALLSFHEDAVRVRDKYPAHEFPFLYQRAGCELSTVDRILTYYGVQSRTIPSFNEREAIAWLS